MKPNFREKLTMKKKVTTGKTLSNYAAEELKFANNLKKNGVFKALKHLGYTLGPREQNGQIIRADFERSPIVIMFNEEKTEPCYGINCDLKSVLDCKDNMNRIR